MRCEVPIKLVKLEEDSYHILVSGKINDRDCILIVDSGASKTVFDINLKEIKLFDDDNQTDKSKWHSAAINSEIIDTQHGVLKKFQLGDISISKFHTVLICLSHINKLYKEYNDMKIDGLLGSDFLVKHKAIIDYPNEKLILHVQDS